ncbi:hypothetical protein [Beijerinckia sp. L45]|uniref:hypothetical protein n=1 Tax=Beijerinckia sp. L45 TaxID=1641855 RepID=UPI00131C40D2|nr:hypothetical protein [Beijerinckia sp. L45]
MTSRWLGFALLLAVLASPAAAITLPLVYTACPTGPGDPTRIEIGEGAKGVRVTFERAGLAPGPFETPDVNLAKISRRLFFTLRTPHGLVEFQGRALDDRLIGRLSDETGIARTISLAAVRNEALERCDGLPDSRK